MAFRDILVSMETGPSAGSCAAFAADLAAKFDARLIGAFAKSQMAPPFMPPDVTVLLTAEEIARIQNEYAAAVDKSAESARAAFEGAAAAAGVTSDWLVLDDAHELVACTRRTDLAVLPADHGHRHGTLSPASLTIASGGPVLITPPSGPHSTFRRILVGWKGSREASRALHAAWPLIALADHVDVVVVGKGVADAPDGLLQRHFERHGVRPNLILDEAEDGLASSVLRREVRARAPDLVILGLYGHSRLQELLLGGVSREMLADPPAPLFVCH